MNLLIVYFVICIVFYSSVSPSNFQVGIRFQYTEPGSSRTEKFSIIARPIVGGPGIGRAFVFEGRFCDTTFFTVTNLSGFDFDQNQPINYIDFKSNYILLKVKNTSIYRSDDVYRMDDRSMMNYRSQFSYIWQNRNSLSKWNMSFSLTYELTDPPGLISDRYPSAKTSLFTIIFLSVCVVLTFVIGIVWSTFVYCRRFQQYRAKKKLQKALAQSIQQILDRSPMLIYDQNNREAINITDDEDPTCAICLETFKTGDKIRKLICSHCFHMTCIDPWLLTRHHCPLCNRNILRNSIPSISSSIAITLSEQSADQTRTHGHPMVQEENSNL